MSQTGSDASLKPGVEATVWTHNELLLMFPKRILRSVCVGVCVLYLFLTVSSTK